MAGRIPAEVFPPGEYIRDELEERGWTQADLAFIMGRPLQAVSGFLTGKRAITPATAKGLAKAFGTSPELWMNLESAYRLAKVKSDDDAVAHRARLLGIAPIKEMVKREWIRDTPGAPFLEQELATFFEVKALDEAQDIQFAARMSVGYGELSPSHRAWLCRAKKLARAVSAAAFRQETFREGLSQLHKYVASEHDVRRVPKLLADLGVRLVIVEHLPKTRIDGAALWVDDKTPAVALSLRFDRIDAFWHTLSHELSHILHGDKFSLDDNLVGEGAKPITDKPDFEQRADREAAEFLISRKEIEGFVLRVSPLFSRTKIIRFANRIQVHPGVIVGQLQHRGEISYSKFRDTLVKVRSTLTEAALTDGWGSAPPLK